MTPLPIQLEVPVLIAGGGAAGLWASIELGTFGLESLLIERHPGTSLIPKAHVLHCRTLEIFRQFGMDEAVRRAGAPPENFSQTSWYTSLGGEEDWDRKILISIPSWSGSTLADYYRGLTASPMANVPQHLLEPVLRARAVELNGPDRVRFSHEVVAVTQDRDGVTAAVRDRATGAETTVRAQYLIVADGGKSIGRMLGVEMLGPPPFVDIVSLAFQADVSAYLQEDDSIIRLFLQPQLDGTVRRFSLIASGPDAWGRDSQEWRGNLVLPAGVVGEPQFYTEEEALRQLRDLLKIPDLEVRGLSMSHWLVEAVLADRFAVGRAFLVGDAAHRHSPMGGLGLNTGLQDVHNLAWKLVHVLSGAASPGLLESYEQERRPVARERVDFATFSFFNHLSVGGGFGMLPGASAEHNRSVLAALVSDTYDGEVRRSQLREMLFTLRREFQHAGLDLGVSYEGTNAVVPDGSAPPAKDPTAYRYEPATRPGGRLPHAWLLRDGLPLATHDLLGPGTHVLLAGDEGAEWIAAAREIGPRRGLEIAAYRVGRECELQETEGSWSALRGHDRAGAILVRPDGHVAYRAVSAPADVRAALSEALDAVTGRGVVPDSAAAVSP